MMVIKNLIKTNLINLGLLVLVVLIYVIFNGLLDMEVPMTLAATGFAGVIWIIYTLYSNYVALNTKDNPILKTDSIKGLNDAGRRGAFSKERQELCTMYNSIMSREKYFGSMDPDSRLPEAYVMIRLQAENDLERATDFINSYDYEYGVYGRDTAYLKETMKDMEGLVKKLNQLVELSYSLDDNIKKVDMRKVDDLIESLQTMKEM